VRFELTFKAFNPKIRINRSLAHLNIRSRADAIAYAEAHHVPLKVKKRGVLQPRPQSVAHVQRKAVNWRIHGNDPPEDYYQLTVAPWEAPDEGEELTIGFKQRCATCVNGENCRPRNWSKPSTPWAKTRRRPRGYRREIVWSA
jgi:argininosuccinate synthase